jgi:hypothetical protein
MHTYRRRAILILHSLLLLFFIIFIFAYVQLKRDYSILNIGFSPYIENMIVIVFSFLSMVKVVFEIYRVEHHEEYEKRVRTRRQ